MSPVTAQAFPLRFYKLYFFVSAGEKLEIRRGKVQECNSGSWTILNIFILIEYINNFTFLHLFKCIFYLYIYIFS